MIGRVFDYVEKGSLFIGVVVIGFVLAVCDGMCLWAMYWLLVRKRSDQSLSVKSESDHDSDSVRVNE